MSQKMKLKKKDRKFLEKFIKSGESKAREITRARILLLSDSKKSPTFISESLGSTFKTIQNIKERYVEGGLDRALYDALRPGAPIKFEGKHRAAITALACTEAPEGYAKWSLRLLSSKAVELGIVDTISHNQLGHILKKTI